MKIPLSGLLFALIVRLFISMVTYHPDIKSQHFHAQYLGRGVVNIYQFVSENKEELPYKDTFNYPPSAYLFLGSWNYLSEVVQGVEINNWINDWNTSSFFKTDMSAYLLLLKTPYFILDLMLLGLLMYLVPVKDRKKLFNIWAFNPISLYVIYAIGQFDVIPALMTLVAMVSFIRKKYLLVGFFLGLAISLKTYPVLLLPIFLIHSRSIKTMLKIGICSVLVYFLTIAPFLGSVDFINSVFKSSLGSKLFEYQLDVSFIKFPIYPLFYISFLLYVFISKKDTNQLNKQLLIVTFSYLIFTNYHPQWIMWSLPFLILSYIKKSISGFLIISMLVLYFVIVLLVPDLYLSIGLFSVLNPNIITMPAFAGFIPFLEQLKFGLKLFFGSIFIYSIFKKAK